jgi:hypothetical protein
MPTFPADEAALAAALNSDPFDAESNQYGLGQGGHRTLFPLGLDAVVDLAQFVKLAGEYLDVLAVQVAADAESASSGSGTESAIENIRAGLSAQYLSIRRIYEANQFVALADAATINWNMAAGINFRVTLGGAGRTIANPTNKIAGKSGLLRVVQDATGGRTITTWGSDYVWIGGQPYWPTTANAISYISYITADDGKIHLQFGGSSA